MGGRGVEEDGKGFHAASFVDFISQSADETITHKALKGQEEKKYFYTVVIQQKMVCNWITGNRFLPPLPKYTFFV